MFSISGKSAGLLHCVWTIGLNLEGCIIIGCTSVGVPFDLLKSGHTTTHKNHNGEQKSDKLKQRTNKHLYISDLNHHTVKISKPYNSPDPIIISTQHKIK
jgi:hypothetical protein